MGQALGLGCRKGCSSLALLPVLPKICFGGTRCLPNPSSLVCEPLSLTDLSLRKGVCALSSRSIFPGFHPCRVLL